MNYEGNMGQLKNRPELNKAIQKYQPVLERIAADIAQYLPSNGRSYYLNLVVGYLMINTEDMLTV